MWAQLIKAQLQPGADLTVAAEAMREFMGQVLAGPPEFVDMTVVAQWVPTDG